MELDNISKRVTLRYTILGFSSLSSFAEDAKKKGCQRDYQWWRRLSHNSSYAYIEEAAQYLGVDPRQLTRKDDNYHVLLEGNPTGQDERVSLKG